MSKPSVIAFSGESGSGKTTLIRRLVALNVAMGLRVGYIKHTHHAAVRAGGGDSATLLAAGAVEAVIAGEWGAIRESDGSRHSWANLEELRRLLPECDRVYVEGFRSLADLPRVHVVRGGDPRGAPDGTIAWVGDASGAGAPRFAFSDLPGLSAFLDTIPER